MKLATKSESWAAPEAEYVHAPDSVASNFAHIFMHFGCQVPDKRGRLETVGAPLPLLNAPRSADLVLLCTVCMRSIKWSRSVGA